MKLTQDEKYCKRTSHIANNSGVGEKLLSVLFKEWLRLGEALKDDLKFQAVFANQRDFVHGRSIKDPNHLCDSIKNPDLLHDHAYATTARIAEPFKSIACKTDGMNPSKEEVFVTPYFVRRILFIKLCQYRILKSMLNIQ